MAKAKARSARNPDLYKITWSGKYGESGEIILFTQRQVDAWVRSMRDAVVAYYVEKIFL
jgi:hypothetical protein